MLSGTGNSRKRRRDTWGCALICRCCRVRELWGAAGSRRVTCGQQVAWRGRSLGSLQWNMAGEALLLFVVFISEGLCL